MMSDNILDLCVLCKKGRFIICSFVVRWQHKFGVTLSTNVGWLGVFLVVFQIQWKLGCGAISMVRSTALVAHLLCHCLVSVEGKE